MISDQRLMELSELAEVAAKRSTPKPDAGEFEAAFKGAAVCFLCNSLFAAIVGVSPRKSEIGISLSVAIVFVTVHFYYRHLWRKWSRTNADWLKMLVADEEKLVVARHAAKPLD